MVTSFEQFKRNIEQVKRIGDLSISLKENTPPELDLSDLLRSELVLLMSAFDHFIHEIVRFGMLQSYRGNRAKSEAYKRFPVSMAGVETMVANAMSEEWLDREIRHKHSWLSFQHPDKVADAIRLVSDAALWPDLGTRLGRSPEDLKLQLKLLFDRRNKIAHEADLKPGIPEERWPIDQTMLNESRGFIVDLGTAIFEMVKPS